MSGEKEEERGRWSEKHKGSTEGKDAMSMNKTVTVLLKFTTWQVKKKNMSTQLNATQADGDKL